MSGSLRVCYIGDLPPEPFHREIERQILYLLVSNGYARVQSAHGRLQFAYMRRRSIERGL
jgi:hypothetical protein